MKLVLSLALSCCSIGAHSWAEDSVMDKYRAAQRAEAAANKRAGSPPAMFMDTATSYEAMEQAFAQTENVSLAGIPADTAYKIRMCSRGDAECSSKILLFGAKSDKGVDMYLFHTADYESVLKRLAGKSCDMHGEFTLRTIDHVKNSMGGYLNPSKEFNAANDKISWTALLKQSKVGHKFMLASNVLSDVVLADYHPFYAVFERRIDAPSDKLSVLVAELKKALAADKK